MSPPFLYCFLLVSPALCIHTSLSVLWGQHSSHYIVCLTVEPLPTLTKVPQLIVILPCDSSSLREASGSPAQVRSSAICTHTMNTVNPPFTHLLWNR